MIITAEISYYPLTDNFENIIDTFIQEILKKDVQIEVGKMSTIMVGEYNEIMNLLTESASKLLERYPSVFNIKISNSCPVYYNKTGSKINN